MVDDILNNLYLHYLIFWISGPIRIKMSTTFRSIYQKFLMKISYEKANVGVRFGGDHSWECAIFMKCLIAKINRKCSSKRSFRFYPYDICLAHQSRANASWFSIIFLSILNQNAHLRGISHHAEKVTSSFTSFFGFLVYLLSFQIVP